MKKNRGKQDAFHQGSSLLQADAVVASAAKTDVVLSGFSGSEMAGTWSL